MELDLSEITIGLSGGLALFLYGMKKLSDGLSAAAGEGLRQLLARLTVNRLAAAATGTVVTAVIQSSSVTTVLVVGFVTAGLMSLSQSIGVILGADIGTTITAQIVAFKVTKYALLLVGVGFALIFLGKKDVTKQYGVLVMGLGMIFFGMGMMSDATKPLREYEPFIDLMTSMGNPLLGMLAGAAFTALVQSSSATTGIVIVLASEGYPCPCKLGRPISGLDAVESTDEVQVFHAGTGLRDGAVVTSGGRVLGVTCLGDDVPAARDRAYAEAKKISFDGVHFRSDIAG